MCREDNGEALKGPDTLADYTSACKYELIINGCLTKECMLNDVDLRLTKEASNPI